MNKRLKTLSFSSFYMLLSMSCSAFSAYLFSYLDNNIISPNQDESLYQGRCRNLHGGSILHSHRCNVQWNIRTEYDHHETSCLLQAKRPLPLSFMGLFSSTMDPQNTTNPCRGFHLGMYLLLCHWL